MAFARNAWLDGDYKKAEAFYMELQEHLGLLGEKEHRSQVISRLGRLTLEQGNVEQAKAYFEEALTGARELQNLPQIAFRMAELSDVFYLQGNIDKYKVSLREAVFRVRALGANAKLYFFPPYAQLYPYSKAGTCCSDTRCHFCFRKR